MQAGPASRRSPFLPRECGSFLSVGSSDSHRSLLGDALKALTARLPHCFFLAREEARLGESVALESSRTWVQIQRPRTARGDLGKVTELLCACFRDNTPACQVGVGQTKPGRQVAWGESGLGEEEPGVSEAGEVRPAPPQRKHMHLLSVHCRESLKF